jgi:hypothetical protein
MGFLDQARMAAQTATAKAKEGMAELQTRRELGQAYDELGKLVFELAEAGEIEHDRFAPLLERIRTLRAELDAG